MICFLTGAAVAAVVAVRSSQLCAGHQAVHGTTAGWWLERAQRGGTGVQLRPSATPAAPPQL
jgi:hypothetical protein